MLEINKHLVTIPRYQKIAESKLINTAQHLKEDLCISFEHALSLAKEMDAPLHKVALWK